MMSLSGIGGYGQSYSQAASSASLGFGEREIVPGHKPACECETCKSRKYKDGSNENDVSFQTAQHVSPQSAGARVRAHEGEHVTNAFEKAKEKGGKVLQASVSIKTAVCPECGRVYVSGGETTTRILYPNESNPYQKERKAQDAANLTGSKINLTA